LAPLTLLPTGAVTSPLPGTELRPVGVYPRVIDPATGLPFRTAEEERRDRIAAEERAALEEQGRQAAEERAACAEAALRDALARLADRQPPT